MQPMLVGAPWERLGLDITGPHPVSAKGNRYILTVIDHFTKWIELIPMRNQEAATVAKLLFERVICTHGCPIQILTDQGTNFESKLFHELCKFLEIDKIRTTPYQPSTNGCIERFHATVHSLIARWVDKHQRHWDQILPAVAFAYRTSVHESTGFTPFLLTFGREARIHADFVYATPARCWKTPHRLLMPCYVRYTTPSLPLAGTTAAPPNAARITTTFGRAPRSFPWEARPGATSRAVAQDGIRNGVVSTRAHSPSSGN